MNTTTKGNEMTDVLLQPVDPGHAHVQKLDVIVGGRIVGRIEQSRRDFIEDVNDRWRDTMTVRHERVGTRWEASPTGEGVAEDWWTFRTRKAALEHVVGGPVGRVTKAS